MAGVDIFTFYPCYMCLYTGGECGVAGVDIFTFYPCYMCLYTGGECGVAGVDIFTSSLVICVFIHEVNVV